MTDSTVIQPTPGTVLLTTGGHGFEGPSWAAATLREVEAGHRMTCGDFKDVTRDLGTTRFQLAEIVNAQAAAAAKTAAELQLHLAKCCCEITMAVREEGKQTRAMINANTIQTLRDANQKHEIVLGAYFAAKVPPVIPG